jgi:hypothetical protein
LSNINIVREIVKDTICHVRSTSHEIRQNVDYVVMLSDVTLRYIVFSNIDVIQLLPV